MACWCSSSSTAPATRSASHGTPQIEAWIPIFLFATIFGISMDYEVFLLSRVREEWDRHHDNERAVAYGLEHTGRIITAAAVIMIAAFSGFMTGRFVGLQEFGVGLAAAIFLDATVVRAILVPATMKLLGDWNWYLPEARAPRDAPRAAADAGDQRALARTAPAAGPAARLSLCSAPRQRAGGRWRRSPARP